MDWRPGTLVTVRHCRGEPPLNRRVIRMLCFDGVTKRFGPLTALDRCTFTVRPGRLTGFLCPNGAGNLKGAWRSALAPAATIPAAGHAARARRRRTADPEQERERR